MAQLILSTYWRSSCSFRVRIALGYKGLAYEPAMVNILEGEQKTPEYLAKNPIGHVPTLCVDGVPYVESVAIMDGIFGCDGQHGVEWGVPISDEARVASGKR